MKNPLRDIYRLFFPNLCAVCGDALAAEGSPVCNACRFEMPLTRFWEREQNPVREIFGGHLPLENASSYFYFVNRSGFRDLVHKFKYGGGWKLAREMGEWYGGELAASPLYRGVELIVPVPLHTRKLLRRGYNQSEYIARGIARAMGVPVDTRSVVRARHNPSQTSKSKKERWENVEGIFGVRDASALHGRHVMLVDDVLTTGATLISCGEAILRAAPTCRLSIVTLAVSKNELDAIKRKPSSQRSSG